MSDTFLTSPDLDPIPQATPVAPPAPDHKTILATLGAELDRAKTEAERIVAEATHALEAGIADAEAFGLRIERDAAGAVAAIWQRL